MNMLGDSGAFEMASLTSRDAPGINTNLQADDDDDHERTLRDVSYLLDRLNLVLSRKPETSPLGPVSAEITEVDNFVQGVSDTEFKSGSPPSDYANSKSKSLSESDPPSSGSVHHY